jgi:hypothetical protein
VTSHAGGRSPGTLVREDVIWATTLFAAAVAVRLVFLAQLEIPPFDPWRHLALVRNIRDGAGFTLFDGQPYLWYGPTWYYLCAALPAWLRIEWFAGLISALSAPTAFLFMRLQTPQASRLAPIVAGVLFGAAGPVVAYTCHYGPEALALLLTLLALLLCTATPRAVGTFLGGLAFGIALTLRLNFVFDSFLFLPWMRGPSRVIAFASGAALPLLLSWWRNHSIIEAYDWVFTWDGLATRSADFNFLSTLVPQIHPAIADGLRRLHEQIIPRPEWIYGSDGFAWGLLLFVACGLAGLTFSRRWPLILAVGSAFFYFLILDRSLSSNYFRIYLVVFPGLFFGIAATAQRLWEDHGFRRWLAFVLVALALLGAAPLLRPAPMVPLEAMNPAPGFLEGDRYLVNSAFFHPESLIYRHPDKSFIGLPIESDQLDAFLAAYPDYRAVLWHDRSIQAEVDAEVNRRADLRRVRESVNAYGVRYRLIPLDRSRVHDPPND